VVEILLGQTNPFLLTSLGWPKKAQRVLGVLGGEGVWCGSSRNGQQR